MDFHIYADESKAHGLLLVAVYVPPELLRSLRAVMNGLRMQGQRRMHFRNESDSRRKQIIRTFADFADVGVRGVVYDATPHRDLAKARRLAVGHLVDDALKAGAERLVLERDDTLVESDQAVIRERLRVSNPPVRPRYDHHRAHEECLLSIPDAIAWCWARGGEWRKRADLLVMGDVRLVEDLGCTDLRLETRNPATYRPEGCRVHFAKTIA